MEVDTSLDHVSPAHQADAAAHGIPGNSQFESSVRVPHLGAVLAQQDLRLEEVLPSEPGGWVRILSALETQDRSQNQEGGLRCCCTSLLCYCRRVVAVTAIAHLHNTNVCLSCHMPHTSTPLYPLLPCVPQIIAFWCAG
jgi:hypothetical protein